MAFEARLETGEVALVDPTGHTVNGGALETVRLLDESGSTILVRNGTVPAGRLAREEGGNVAKT